MKTKLLILSDKLLLGNLDFSIQDFSFFLFEKGLDLTFAHVCMFADKTYERFLNYETLDSQFNIVVAENEKIDGLIASAGIKFCKDKEIINEQGVLLQGQNSSILFLPIECDVKMLTSKALKIIDFRKTRISLSVFGENPIEIENFLKSKNIKYRICEKNLLSRVIVDTEYSKFYEEFKEKFTGTYSSPALPLEKKVFDLLKSNNKTLSIVESVTGGSIVSSLIRNNEGISKYVKEGLTLYMPSAKKEVLDIDEEIIRDFTCESMEMSGELAKKLLIFAGTDLVLTITGDASSEKAGIIYIAIGDIDEIHGYKFRLSGSRNEIIETATNVALYNLIKFLENM